jgi:diguanylate cyclase (GGDEF)-like protein
VLHHDALTGMPARAELLDDVARAVAGGEPAALVVLDIDGFAALNDTVGFRAGDDVLCDVARIVRTLMPPGSSAGRLDGDVFGLLLPDVDADRACALASTLLRAVRNRARVLRRAGPPITASAGVAVSGGVRAGAEELLACAELAVREAKAGGRDRVVCYDRDVDRRGAMLEAQRWVDRLRDPGGRVVVHGQRVWSTDPADDVVRVELLVRFQQDDGSLAPPGLFLPIAERTGLIGRIDRHVLRTAVELLMDARRPLEVAVNLSAQTFADPDLPAYLDTLCGGVRTPGAGLLVELTETAALADAPAVAAVAAALRARGARIALDDFGSGFATFGYLQRLAVDVLKVDGGFVRDLTAGPNQRIVASMVSLARSLELPVIAEQVETPEALRLLVDMGVDHVQGYLLGRPGPLEEVLAADPRAVARALEVAPA